MKMYGARNSASALITVVFFVVAVVGIAEPSSTRLLGDKGPTVKTIKSEDGDIIDCFDLYKQPTFDHPQLKNHVIQVGDYSTKRPLEQTWQRSGRCPDGTIPVLRVEKSELAKVSSFSNNGRAYFSMAYNNASGPFEQTYGIIYAWDTHVEPLEFSMNLVGCTNSADTFPASGQKILAVGWGVAPSIFNDTKSRIIIARSIDEDLKVWCFNFGCPGFIQTNKEIALGGILKPVSTYNGQQYSFTASLYRDRHLAKWIVAINEVEFGYFLIKESDNFWDCKTAIWGGAVLSQSNFPTPTQMANGHFSNEGPGKTGFVRNAYLVRPSSGNPSGEDPSGYAVTRPLCYNFHDVGAVEVKTYPGRTYAYGGPGSMSAQCV